MDELILLFPLELIFPLWSPFLLELLQGPLETMKGFIMEVQRHTYLCRDDLKFLVCIECGVPYTGGGQVSVPHLWVVPREAEATSGFEV